MPSAIIPELKSLQQNEAIIEKGLHTFYEVGNALVSIRDGKQYKETHSTFEAYCVERWGITRQHANRLIVTTKVMENLEPVGSTLPDSERQLREIAKAPPEEQAQVWQQAQQNTGKEQPTAKEISEVVNKNAHVSHNSGENEWYTPIEFIESARAVMGDIDVDPASSDLANETVKASCYYTKEGDGLSVEWEGRIWMNPPYAQPLITQFTEKLIDEINSGRVTESIVLVNNATETNWFQNIARYSNAICFIDSRVKFLDPDGNKGAPLQGQAAIYYGDNIDSFIGIFGLHGLVLETCHG